MNEMKKRNKRINQSELLQTTLFTDDHLLEFRQFIQFLGCVENTLFSVDPFIEFIIF